MLAVFAALVATAAGAQRIVEYTETASGPDQLPLNFPVPIAVASLTPVEGFRDHASLHARLQSLAMASDDLAAHVVGTTQGQGRLLYAYVVSDADGVDGDGRPEAAFLINAATHAREWAAPEVSVGLVERMVQGATDRGLVRYLLDHTRLVIVPVHNVDGRLQTERFPNRVVVGRDPFVPDTWPRDGRMRRKNMRGADQDLGSFGDHLRGVDLNRNHPPFWATSVNTRGSSPDPDTLIYHGQGVHSEAENRALEAAVALAPASRIRLGIDIHSFSQLFFSANTGRTRLNGIQSALLALLDGHHRTVSRSERFPSGLGYRDVPDPINRGIGVAAEYFAYQFLVPAWTLELEPSLSQGARQYGGFDPDGHSGFILPESQARRVREAWSETHLVAFYHMAGPPHLQRVRVLDSAGRVVVDRKWMMQGTGRRALADRISQPLVAGREYRAELVFSKPMRVRDEAGAAVAFAGAQVRSLPPEVVLTAGTGTLAPGDGAWQIAGSRYRDDTWAFGFTATAAGELALSVDVDDASGHALDADPATPVDWQDGAWSGYEDAAGVAGDVGGADDSMAFAVVAAAPDVIAIGPVPAAVGEGDRLRIRLERAAPAAGVVAEATWSSCVGDGIQCDFITFEGPVTWSEGEGGERFIEIELGDDLEDRGVRPGRVQVSIVVGNAPASVVDFEFEVADNDGPDMGVVRVVDSEAAGGLPQRGAGGRTEWVFDGLERASAVSAGGADAQVRVDGELSVFGNHTVLAVSDSGTPDWMFRVPAGASLMLSDLTLDNEVAGATPGAGSAGIVANDGSLLVRRSNIELGCCGPGVVSRGELRYERVASSVNEDNDRAALEQEGGTGSVEASTFAYELATAPLWRVDGTLSARDSSWQGFPFGSARSVEATNALAIDELARVVGTPPPQPPLSCAQPLVTDQGRNLYAAIRDGRNITDELEASGCVAGAAVDEFLAASVQPTDLKEPGLVPVAGGPAHDAVDPSEQPCGPIDLRGAPRPQTLVDGGEPLCDIGAIELGVNPYRGLWIPDRSGHGIDIHTADNRLFITWFTYTDEGTPTAYLAVAPLTGPRWSARLLSSRLPGGEFPNEVFEVGDIEIVFESDVQARLRWRFDARGTWGEEGIRAHVFALGEPRFETTGSWYAPAESGYGVVVTRRGAVTGAVVYYYDRDGAIRWVLGSGPDGDVADLPMLSFTGFCPDCDAQAMPPVPQQVGRMRLQFLTPERMRVLSMDWSYPGGNGGLWRREDAAMIRLNSPVDNRAAGALAESLLVP
ncbi:MAG TPA: M14 family zinc carboxypeptidase [Xanthomonadaceae bacterium]|nr:M14 family zinc carboxypeptidase [Xanthomonadaceae bacterium]